MKRLLFAGPHLGTLSLLCAGLMACSVSLLAAEKTTLIQVRDIEKEGRQRLVDELKTNGKPPIEYVVGKLRKHDLVLLGETHKVHENCRFVADLIKPLYEAGVRQLASEFFCTRSAERVEKLVTAETFDDRLVTDLLRDHPWPTWGYQEYGDILKSVWRLNRDLPKDAEKFRVICLDSDWDQHDLWFGKGGPKAHFESTMRREKHMASLLEQEALVPGRKTLVHIGFAHTVTCHGMRLGTVLFEKYGSRIFQVCLHQEHPSQQGRAPLTTFLETVVAESGRDSVEFDVLGSPFASLAEEKTMYWRMKSDAGFASFAQGYVFLAPLDELHSVTWIDGFINESNFKKARAVAKKMRWIGEGECQTPKELDATLAERFCGP